MNQPIRFAIAGFGNIGKRHAEQILKNPGAILTAVCDIDEKLENEVPEKVAYFNSFDQFLKQAYADVVCICTPNFLHEEQTIAALQAGFHTVVEKPMAISSVSCDRMIEASEKTGKLIFAVKQNRYNPPVQSVKKIIDDGSLGKLYMIQVNCFWNRGDNYYHQSSWRGKKNLDGGCLFTQFSHFVDILYYLAGPMESAEGFIHNYAHQHNTEFEDSGVFVLKTKSGALVSFSFTTCSYEQNMEGAITIFGENGTVKIGGQYLNTIEYQRLKNGNLPSINISAKANDYGTYMGSMSNHHAVIQNVIDVLVNDHKIMVSAQEGREVVRLIEQMYGGAITI